MKTLVLCISLHSPCLSGIMWVVESGARKNKGSWTIFRDSWRKDRFQFLEPLEHEMVRIKPKAEFTQRFQARSGPCRTELNPSAWNNSSAGQFPSNLVLEEFTKNCVNLSVVIHVGQKYHCSKLRCFVCCVICCSVFLERSIVYRNRTSDQKWCQNVWHVDVNSWSHETKKVQ
jgi:hypothetical protein